MQVWDPGAFSYVPGRPRDLQVVGKGVACLGSVDISSK